MIFLGSTINSTFRIDPELINIDAEYYISRLPKLPGGKALIERIEYIITVIVIEEGTVFLIYLTASQLLLVSMMTLMIFELISKVFKHFRKTNFRLVVSRLGKMVKVWSFC